MVNDGSSDATSVVASTHGVEVLDLPFNLGVGGAMRAGFRYALAHGYDVVVQVDADGQHDPRDVPRLAERLADADVVIGARFAGAGEYRVGGPRRWAMVVLARSLSRVGRTRLTDATSGFRAAGPRAVQLFAVHYPAEYLGDTVESLVIAMRSGLTVEQVGVSMRERSAGRPSQRPWKAAIYLVRACLALVIALTRPRVAVAGIGAGPMSGYVFAVVGALVTLAFMIEMLRRRRLREKYAALWITVAVASSW